MKNKSIHYETVLKPVLRNSLETLILNTSWDMDKCEGNERVGRYGHYPHEPEDLEDWFEMWWSTALNEDSDEETSLSQVLAPLSVIGFDWDAPGRTDYWEKRFFRNMREELKLST